MGSIPIGGAKRPIAFAIGFFFPQIAQSRKFRAKHGRAVPEAALPA